MKILIQILTLSLFVLFSLSGNAQTKPDVRYAKPKYNTKNIYKPSNKKKVLNYKTKQKKKDGGKYVMVVEKGVLSIKKVSLLCFKYRNSDCEDMPSFCQEYYDRCSDEDEDDDDSPNLEDAFLSARQLNGGRDGGLPDDCGDEIPINGSDDCYPNPSLRNFSKFLHAPGELYSISIKTPKGKTIAYMNTKRSKKTMVKNLNLGNMRVKLPKYKGKAIFKVTNLKTKKTNSFSLDLK